VLGPAFSTLGNARSAARLSPVPALLFHCNVCILHTLIDISVISAIQLVDSSKANSETNNYNGETKSRDQMVFSGIMRSDVVRH
jgi:hypothetical protein